MFVTSDQHQTDNTRGRRNEESDETTKPGISREQILLCIVTVYVLIITYPQARIQDSEGGGGSYIQKGGVSYRNFRSGSKLLQGPGQINKQKKIADSRRGGGSDDPPKNPVSAHVSP